MSGFWVLHLWFRALQCQNHKLVLDVFGIPVCLTWKYSGLLYVGFRLEVKLTCLKLAIVLQSGASKLEKTSPNPHP